MRILLNLSYNGHHYYGFQYQHDARTIQGEIEAILAEMHHREMRIHPASRTDRGVHARDQYIHFDTDLTIEPAKWAYILNTRLDDDIYIKSSMEVSPDFHVRYHPSKKTYRYKLYTGDKNPFYAHLKTHVSRELDIELLRKTAKDFIGTHDFTSFSSAKGVIQNRTRTIYDCHVEIDDSHIDLVITGTGFLYNMVRIIVAYMLQVATHERPRDTNAILAARDRTHVPRTAPAHGLYLEKIEYE